MRPGRRRQFLMASGALLVARIVGGQDARRVHRIGFLSPADAVTFKPSLDAFTDAMRGLGWIEGKNIVIEVRYAEGNQSRMPDLARDLVGQGVEIILPGTTPGTVAARDASPNTPIVMTATLDAQSAGLVSDLARPGGNVTGLTQVSLELMGKRLQLLKEAIPSVTRLGYLTVRFGPTTNPQVRRTLESAAQATEAAARRVGIELHTIAVFGEQEVESSFARFQAARVHALYAIEGSLTTYRAVIARLALDARLLTMFGVPTYVEAGGLMSYGPDLLDLYRRAATYVDKILKGAKPGDLPVEQPTRYELVINAKAAEALGLRIPQAILVRADRVIG
jgi:putative tryptophan/tyrosine transport system substrate-binding protein